MLVYILCSIEEYFEISATISISTFHRWQSGTKVMKLFDKDPVVSEWQG